MHAALPMNAMIEKLQRLPPERVSEVEDFIDFLASRETDQMLVRSAQELSTASLKAIWENADDAEYDQL